MLWEPSTKSLVAIAAYASGLPVLISGLMGGPFVAPREPLGGAALSLLTLVAYVFFPLLFHVVMRKLGGAGTNRDSYRIITYFLAAMFPAAFVGVLGRTGMLPASGWLLPIAFVAAIATWWNCYGLISHAHHVSRFRAFLAHSIAFALLNLAWVVVGSLLG
jgi:hypothetical protein